MPIQDLLSQIRIEYEILQSKYDQLLMQVDGFRDRFPILHDTDSAIPSSQKRRFAIETHHGACPLEQATTMESSLPTASMGIALETHTSTLTTASMASRSRSWHRTHRTMDSDDMAAEDNTKIQSHAERLNKVRKSAEERNQSYYKVTSPAKTQTMLADQTLKGRARRILINPYFEMIIALIVICNVVAMWLEADIRAKDADLPPWLLVVGVLYLIIYCVEFSIRVLAFGTYVFVEHWNKLDFSIILIDVVIIAVRACLGLSWDGGSVQVLRLFRLFRLARVVKILRFAPELQLLIHGFYGAAKAIVFAALMLWIVIILWSFVYVEFIGPYVKEMTDAGFFDSCPECQISYSSMFDTSLTLIQKNVAGDSWGKLNLDVIRNHPETTPIFLCSLATILLGLMNLILTVIVDAAARSREEAQQHILEEKEMKFAKIKEQLIQMMQIMDVDGSGELTYEEMKEGFDTFQEFADAMSCLDITRDDLATVFMIMDEDRSGTVSYTEFVNNLYKLKQQDMETTLFFIKGYVYDIRFKVRNDLKRMIENMSWETSRIQQQMHEIHSMVGRADRNLTGDVQNQVAISPRPECFDETDGPQETLPQEVCDIKAEKIRVSPARTSPSPVKVNAPF